eukprot:1773522-Alexandrium_andersonii.AAC.1
MHAEPREVLPLVVVVAEHVPERCCVLEHGAQLVLHVFGEANLVNPGCQDVVLDQVLAKERVD